MDGGGGSCNARYDGSGCCGGLSDMSKLDRIMLKFRPIAPKPVAAGSGGSPTDVYVRSGRGRRKYVRSNGNKTDRNNLTRCTESTVAERRKVSQSSSSPPSQSVSGGGEPAVTLSLMPDRPEEPPIIGSIKCTGNNHNKSAPIWSSFNNHHQTALHDGHVRGGYRHVVSDHAVVMPRREAVVSFVTVECVTETWMGGDVVGCTDEERLMKMERDTCPGFISDGGDRVVWMNKAYREMGGGDEMMAVVLVRKGNWVPYPAFTCKVKVTCGSSSFALTAPCDAWRMASGGYAWRLDVDAALCLGR